MGEQGIVPLELILGFTIGLLGWIFLVVSGPASSLMMIYLMMIGGGIAMCLFSVFSGRWLMDQDDVNYRLIGQATTNLKTISDFAEWDSSGWYDKLNDLKKTLFKEEIISQIHNYRATVPCLFVEVKKPSPQYMEVFKASLPEYNVIEKKGPDLFNKKVILIMTPKTVRPE